MNETKTKISLRKHLTRGNLFLLAVLVIAVLFAFGSVQAMQKNYSLQAQVDSGQLDNDMQAVANENLRLQQAYFKTNEFLELQARDKLNKAFAGERMVWLPTTDQVTNIDTGSATPTSTTSNFEQWMGFLFSKHS